MSKEKPRYIPYGQLVEPAFLAEVGDEIVVYPGGERAKPFDARVVRRKEKGGQTNLIVEASLPQGRERLSIGGGTAVVKYMIV